ncbi:hypothetical protein [Enterocloster bolteae]|uniref:hypothetical protein n=1 Tax=Enterocloster bolteae TaxID=208479 RepID=UPI0034A4A720
MGTQLLILVSMVFCHIVDDYYLQGWLASAKQKSWWEQNAPEKLYKYDYIAALLMHSFSWTFMVMLIPTVYVILFGGTWYPLLFVGNVLVHMIVDDLKANKKRINLIQDQSIHMLQIIWTWLCMIVL